MSIAIGKTSAGKILDLPIDLGTQTVSVLGIRGSGKTHTARRFAEGLLDANHQVIVIDPLDVWWGLRSSRSGDRSGYPIVVLGGDHQDLALEATAGKVIAEFAVHRGASLILSTRHLSKNDTRRFVTDFAERLYEMKGRGEYRTPLHLLIDEADMFAPQRLHAGMERLYGSIDQLVRRGRASGIGVTLITQRAAVLNKDVLTQSELLVCHRTVGPQDRKAIESWVEVHDVEGKADEVLASLAQLERGEAWFWSPGWLQVLVRVKVGPSKTFDSSATPKAGETVAAPKRVAEVDLAALQQAMAATIEKVKADDPRELRKQIAELQRRPVSRTEPQAKSIEVPVVGEEDRKLLLGYVKKLADTQVHIEQLNTLLSLSGPLLARLNARLLRGQVAGGLVPAGETRTSPVAARRPGPPSPPPTPARQPVTRSPGGHSAAGEHNLGSGGLRRILTALAQRPQGLSYRQLGLRACLASRHGTFRTYVGQARARQWVAGNADGLQITDAGLAALGEYEVLPSGRALLDWWLVHPRVGRGSGAARMLEVLADRFPEDMSKEDLGQAAGLDANHGTFRTYMGKLRTLELVTYEGGRLRLSEELA